MKRLAIISLMLLTGCALIEPYWINTHEADTRPLKPMVYTPAPCGNPADDGCYNRKEIRAEVHERWRGNEWMTKCLIGHEATGKFSHRNGYSHEQWPALPNGVIRPNCGDEP